MDSVEQAIYFLRNLNVRSDEGVLIRRTLENSGINADEVIAGLKKSEDEQKENEEIVKEFREKALREAKDFADKAAKKENEKAVTLILLRRNYKAAKELELAEEDKKADAAEKAALEEAKRKEKELKEKRKKICLRCGEQFSDAENKWGVCRWHTTLDCVEAMKRLYPQYKDFKVERPWPIGTLIYPLLSSGVFYREDKSVYICCGREEGSRGCWIGLHSDTDPTPTLKDTEEMTAWEPSSLTRYVNDSESRFIARLALGFVSVNGNEKFENSGLLTGCRETERMLVAFRKAAMELRDALAKAPAPPVILPPATTPTPSAPPILPATPPAPPVQPQPTPTAATPYVSPATSTPSLPAPATVPTAPSTVVAPVLQTVALHDLPNYMMQAIIADTPNVSDKGNRQFKTTVDILGYINDVVRPWMTRLRVWLIDNQPMYDVFLNRMDKIDFAKINLDENPQSQWEYVAERIKELNNILEAAISIHDAVAPAPLRSSASGQIIQKVKLSPLPDYIIPRDANYKVDTGNNSLNHCSDIDKYVDEIMIPWITSLQNWLSSLPYSDQRTTLINKLLLILGGLNLVRNDFTCTGSGGRGHSLTLREYWSANRTDEKGREKRGVVNFVNDLNAILVEVKAFYETIKDKLPAPAPAPSQPSEEEEEQEEEEQQSSPAESPKPAEIRKDVVFPKPLPDPSMRVVPNKAKINSFYEELKTWLHETVNTVSMNPTLKDVPIRLINVNDKYNENAKKLGDESIPLKDLAGEYRYWFDRAVKDFKVDMEIYLSNDGKKETEIRANTNESRIIRNIKAMVATETLNEILNKIQPISDQITKDGVIGLLSDKKRSKSFDTLIRALKNPKLTEQFPRFYNLAELLRSFWLLLLSRSQERPTFTKSIIKPIGDAIEKVETMLTGGLENLEKEITNIIPLWKQQADLLDIALGKRLVIDAQGTLEQRVEITLPTI